MDGIRRVICLTGYRRYCTKKYFKSLSFRFLFFPYIYIYIYIHTHTHSRHIYLLEHVHIGYRFLVGILHLSCASSTSYLPTYVLVYILHLVLSQLLFSSPLFSPQQSSPKCPTNYPPAPPMETETVMATTSLRPLSSRPGWRVC